MNWRSYIPFLGFRDLTKEEIFQLGISLNSKWEAFVFEWFGASVYIMCRRK